MTNRKPNTTCSSCENPIYRRPGNLAISGGKAYCSKECYGKSCHKPTPCIICSTPVLASRNCKTCSKECFKKSLLDLNRNFSKGRPPKSLSKYGTKSFRIRIIEERGPCCEVCGYDKIPVLNIHHIIERSKGGSDLPSNLMILCANCHGEVHTGILDISEFIDNNTE
jgi:5-methylcytosine-specific restriction endonuclease McrA